MQTTVKYAVPVLPAVDVAASLAWWTRTCGFSEVFRHGTPPVYAGIQRDEVLVHFTSVEGQELARTVGEQTMLRIAVEDVEAMCAEFKERGGTVHPHGGLAEKPWGGLEFAVIDPAGVCVTFFKAG